MGKRFTDFTYSDKGKCRLFPLREYNPQKKPELPKLPGEEPDTQFKRNYPPDQELGQELSENARVWHVYRDQAIQHDDSRLSGWNNTINILLTFAGLFSAAVTAFVVESYQFLQPPGLDLGLALYSLAVNDTTTLLSLATSHSQPSSPARWINGLWFTSLFFSLAAAFLCILVKQWLDEYTARTRASSQNPKHWTRRRTFYFRAIDAWGVPVIISLLPLLLHTALFLLFAGVVILLWSLNRALAAWLSSLALPALCLYVVSLLIPVWNAACPFATPLANVIRELWALFIVWFLPAVVTIFEHAAVAMFRMQGICSCRPLSGAILPHPRSLYLWSTSSVLRDGLRRTVFDQVMHLDSLRSGENHDAEGSDIALADRLDSDALSWLIQSVSDPDASAVALQALGAAEPFSDLAEQLISKGLTRTRPQYFVTSPSRAGPVEAARILKSIIVLRDFTPNQNRELSLAYGIHDGLILRDLLEPALSYPDVCLLWRTLSSPYTVTFVHEGIRYRIAWIQDETKDWHLSRSLHSTCTLICTTPTFDQPHILPFLSHCNLALLTSAQWAFLMPKLWGTDGPCPHHGLDLSHCRASCLAELLSRLLLQNVLHDEIVLTRLWEKACSHLPILSDLPEFLRYITSDTFLDSRYSDDALWGIQRHLDDWKSWAHMPTVNLEWITAWRHLAHLLPSYSAAMFAPSDLISSALTFRGDLHRVEAIPFSITLPAEAVLRSILDGSRTNSRSIPSLWQLVIDNDELWESCIAFFPLLDALARSLCSLSRSGDELDEPIDGIDAFFVMHFTSIIRMFYDHIEIYTWSKASDSNLVLTSRFPTTFVAISRHLMELRPSWWTEGMNLLTSEAHITQDTSMLTFAKELTAESLRKGPCSDCPLSDASRTFDVSLRNFVPFPFSVYPVADGDPEQPEFL